MNPWACPAGDPCPGTGCHACCPSYDPCGKSECKTCHVDDPVHHNQLVARGLIHHKWNEDEVHVPEEADTMTDLEECDWVVRMATPETPDEYCGLEVPRGNEFCPRHQKKTDNMARWEARAAEKEKFLGDNRPMPAKPCADREPHPSHLWHYKADGETRWCIGLSSPEEPSKLQQTLSEIGQAVSEYPHDDGDVIVLGPEIFLDKETQVISWKGKNYAPVEVPEPLTEVKRDISADCRYARQSAAEWAVSLIRPTVTPDTLVSNTANTTVQLAQRLYDWLIQE